MVERSFLFLFVERTRRLLFRLESVSPSTNPFLADISDAIFGQFATFRRSDLSFSLSSSSEEQRIESRDFLRDSSPGIDSGLRRRRPGGGVVEFRLDQAFAEKPRARPQQKFHSRGVGDNGRDGRGKVERERGRFNAECGCR